jgi:hypothetical protein
MSVEQNKLSNVSNFDTNRIIFSKVQKKSANNITYNTISIKVKNTKFNSSELDGTVGDLVFATSEIWSPGVQENKFAPGTWSMPLFLYGMNGASDNEKMFVNVFNSIVEHAKNHIVGVRSDIGKPRLTVDSDSFEKFNPLWFKRDKETGEIEKDSSPVFYVKLMQNKRGGDYGDNVLSKFADATTKKIIEFKDMINKKCNVKAVVKFESIFINAKTISLQIKLVDACVRTKSAVQYYLTEGFDETPVEDGGEEKSLANDFKTTTKISEDYETPLARENSDSEDDSGSVKASDDESEVVVEPQPVVEAKTKRAKRNVK